MTLSVENELMSLKASLETADEVVEKTLIAYDKNDYEYETLKHEAFAELNQVIIDLKSLVKQIEPDLNMRPIERILEDDMFFITSEQGISKPIEIEQEYLLRQKIVETLDGWLSEIKNKYEDESLLQNELKKLLSEN